MSGAFDDRAAAGRELAHRLSSFRGGDAVVLGLPRGGVPVAFEVAWALGAPLDVVVVCGLEPRSRRGLGCGVVGEAGVCLIDDEVVWKSGIGTEELAALVERDRGELGRRAGLLRGGRPRVEVGARTVIVVDDGVVSGATAHVACRVACELGAAEVVLAVPVATPQALERLEEVTDEQVCLRTPGAVVSLGAWYRAFPAVSDGDVVALLEQAAQRQQPPA